MTYATAGTLYLLAMDKEQKGSVFVLKNQHSTLPRKEEMMENIQEIMGNEHALYLTDQDHHHRLIPINEQRQRLFVTNPFQHVEDKKLTEEGVLYLSGRFALGSDHGVLMVALTHKDKKECFYQYLSSFCMVAGYKQPEMAEKKELIKMPSEPVQPGVFSQVVKTIYAFLHCNIVD